MKISSTIKGYVLAIFGFVGFGISGVHAQMEFKDIVSIGYVRPIGNMAAANFDTSSSLGMTNGLHLGLRLESGEESWFGGFVGLGLNFHGSKKEFRNSWAKTYEPNTNPDLWKITSGGGIVADLSLGVNINAAISDNICFKPFVSVGYNYASLPNLQLRTMDDELVYQEDYGSASGVSLGWGVLGNFKVFDTWVSLAYTGKTAFSLYDRTVSRPLLNETYTDPSAHVFTYQEFTLGIDLADIIM